MNRIALTTFLAIALVPSVAADHWDDDTPGAAPFGDSTCTWSALLSVPGDADCAVDYACTGGTPPQVVDTALYCAARAAGEAADVVRSVPLYAWTVADFHATKAGEAFGAPHDALQPVADDANEPLCNVVWSFFCTNPLSIPSDPPLPDPINDFPL